MNYEQIEISKINRSSYNPRRVFDDSKIAELAHNIREQGLLQPITVRPIANGYEIVCGERRWRAFQWNIVHGYTGYLTMPCIVREMTDDEAFDAAITENLQRQDVEPMDEAIAFNQLLDRGQSITDLVARFGKSETYIRSRISLNKLIPELAAKIGVSLSCIQWTGESDTAGYGNRRYRTGSDTIGIDRLREQIDHTVVRGNVSGSSDFNVVSVNGTGLNDHGTCSMYRAGHDQCHEDRGCQGGPYSEEDGSVFCFLVHSFLLISVFYFTGFAPAFS